VENAAFYEREGADQLAMLDIAATVESRKTRLEWVRAVSAAVDLPLTVGGASPVSRTSSRCWRPARTASR